jgi:flagellar motor protein MotB
MNMSVLGKTMVLLVVTVAVLASCATAPAQTVEDPRVGTLQAQVDGLLTQLAEKDAALAELKAAPAAETAEKPADDRIATLEARLSEFSVEVKELGDQLLSKNARLGDLEKELSAIKAENGRAGAAFNSLKTQYATLQKTNTELSANLQALKSGATRSEADYLAKIADLKQGISDLQSAITELEKERDALQIAAQASEKDLNDRVAQFRKLFETEIVRGDLDIKRYRDVLVISVKDAVLFAPDSAVLKPESLPILGELAEVFRKAPDRIVRVEGNTATGLSSAQTLRLYPSSWHLGSARSSNVVQYLQESCSLDPLQLVAVSLGEFRPKSDNSTDAGKSLNRRVDFVLIARALYELDELSSQLQ